MPVLGGPHLLFQYRPPTFPIIKLPQTAWMRFPGSPDLFWPWADRPAVSVQPAGQREQPLLPPVHIQADNSRPDHPVSWWSRPSGNEAARHLSATL